MEINEILKGVEQNNFSINEALSLIKETKRKNESRNTILPVAGSINKQLYEWEKLGKFFEGHKVFDMPVLFGMMHLSFIIQYCRNKQGSNHVTAVKDVLFEKPVMGKDTSFSISISENAEGKLQSTVDFSNGNSFVSASAKKDTAISPSKIVASGNNIKKYGEEIYPDDLYALLKESGIAHAPYLQCISKTYRTANKVFMELDVSPEIKPFENGLEISPVLLNAGYTAFIFCNGFDNRTTYLPLSIRSVEILKPLSGRCTVLAELYQSNDQILKGDVYFFDETGAHIASLNEIIAKKIESPTAIKIKQDKTNQSAQKQEKKGRSLQELIMEYLKEYIARVLKINNHAISSNETFLNLGLESGQLINSVRDLENAWQIELYPTLFFEHQTILELSKYVEENFREKLQPFFQSEFRQAKEEEIQEVILTHKTEEIDPEQKKETKTIETPFEGVKDTDIAIIGMGGQFPKSENIAAFWKNLETGVDMVSEVPDSRWNMNEWFAEEGGENKSYSKWGSFINDISLFDADFFNISPREAKTMDPQLRLLLQAMYHTAEDAGKIKQINGSETGVYVGACFREYWDEMIRLQKKVDSYDLTGSAMTFLANRPAYYFNLKGPSITVDNACSSSLVALHMACQGLISGDCEMAFVAGVNLLISPLHYLHFSSIQALSRKGRCFAFDEKADGYVPGEAVCSILLKPLKKAIQDGDSIHAVIKGTSTNHGGKSNSLTAPSINQQVALLHKTWKSASVSPAEISYIEAHGTGTKLGDPIEVKALNNAFSKYTDKKSFCAIGSAKAHLGHTEGAAGLVSVIKGVLMMKHAVIPAMPNFTNVNPLLELKNSPLFINKNKEDWKTENGIKKIIGVSSFGIGGGYAHAVLEEAPVVDRPSIADQQPHLLVFSARTQKSLQEYLYAFHSFLENSNEAIQIKDLSYSLMLREAFKVRTCWNGNDKTKLMQDLKAFANGDRSAWKIVHLDDNTYEELDVAQKDLQTLSNEWLQGISLKMIKSSANKIHHLPGYAFDEKSFWFESSEIDKPSMKTPVSEHNHQHPLLDEMVRNDSSAVFKKNLKPNDHVWKGHQINGKKVLPGVAHLEMAKAAGEIYSGKEVTAILDHYWFVPITTSSEALDIYLKLEEKKDHISYQLTDNKIVFSSGTLSYDPLPAPAAVSLEHLVKRCSLTRTGASVYEEIKQLGAELDSDYQTMKQVHGGKNISLLEWNTTNAETYKRYTYAPVILDVFNHGIRGIEGIDQNSWGLRIPYHLKEIRFYENTLPPQGYVATFYNTGQRSPAFGCSAFNAEGKILYQVIDFISQELKTTKKEVFQNEEQFIKKEGLTEVTSIQNSLKILVGEVLDKEIESIKGHVNLADYGLDSVSIAQFIKKLNQAFKLEISPAVFFEYKTLDDLATFLIKEGVTVTVTVEQKRKEETIINSIHTSEQVEQNITASTPEKVKAQDFSPTGDIAIIGMDGCFPDSSNLNEFWEHLKNGDCMIDNIPLERFNWKEYIGDVSLPNKMITKSGGFMEDVDCFDAPFFGISRHEAELMDPQQRLLLQTVWKTVESAGYAPSKLRDSNTGIFVGVVNNEYYELLNEAGVEIEAHTSTGMARSILPNRISSYFDWHGPSEPVDTACSSSLVAIHRASQSIHSGECDMAVAGGINMLLTPKLFISFSKAGMLSEEGLCKTFDKNANGYVRGEGIGMILLKKLDKAILDKDNILAVIKGSGINHGGHANSLTTPNPNEQAKLMKSVWKRANISPDTITYIEAHGTGTPLGDPIEVNGIKLACSEYPIFRNRTGIGSVKSNIGHLESAAGIAGLIKVILAMRHQLLPATINYAELNPYIVLENSSLYIADKAKPWSTLTDINNSIIPRRAGINSFGFGGANAHVLLEEFVEKDHSDISKNSPVLIVLSAKSQAALKRQAISLMNYLQETKEQVNMFSLSSTLTVGRDQLPFRFAFVTAEISSLIQELEFFINDKKGDYRTSESSDSSKEISFNYQDLESLASLWVKGGEAKFETLVHANAKKMYLPTYVFEKLKYWIPERKILHPVDSIIKKEKTKPIYEMNTSMRFVEEVTNKEEIEMILGN